MKLTKAMFASLLIAAGPAAHAHGEAAHAKKPQPKATQAVEEKPFGRPGDPKKVTRTIPIDMNDQMEYRPNALRLRAGETVRLVVRNSGRIMHELVLGTMDDLKEHAELMRRHPTMEHEEPYMAHVQPGKTETIVWQFTRPGVFYYGCLIPGHWEAGMVGRIVVRAHDARQTERRKP